MEQLAQTRNNPKAVVLGKALDDATARLLDNLQSPGRKVRELNNQGSHAHLDRYRAEALAAQNEDAELKAHFTPIAEKPSGNIDQILQELDVVQGKPVDLGGYYHADPAKVTAAMRASASLNAIIDG
ncbi:MAG: NADP-dependent isocitrate dehydrogenase [Nitrospirota bacterium]|jgi:isocitrate dehydrogenase